MRTRHEDEMVQKYPDWFVEAKGCREERAGDFSKEAVAFQIGNMATMVQGQWCMGNGI